MLSNLDMMRAEASSVLHPERKSQLGQFMTPSPIAEFMASLFDGVDSDVRLLDAGAGIGSLSLALLERSIGKASSVHLDAWEIERMLLPYLKSNLLHFQNRASRRGLDMEFRIHEGDFIEDAVLDIAANRNRVYSHCIINPPYKKISSNSKHRFLLRKAGIETVNLYSAFLALCIRLLGDNGQLVAIVPRSFCNGTYYKPFRRYLLERCCVSHLHVFESRRKAFEDDGVLQENVIVKLVKGLPQTTVKVSSSSDSSFCDYLVREVEANDVISKEDSDYFIKIPTTSGLMPWPALFSSSLEDNALEVSTGPVVDFRVRGHCSAKPTAHCSPLLYPQHFIGGELCHPREIKKPNWISVNAETLKLLMPMACYTVVKRFTSKEEKRRVVAYVVDPRQLSGLSIGFENHLNVFHADKCGLDEKIAHGLSLFLNSSLVDGHFRLFSGHTQVNANDLRLLKYPSTEQLVELGSRHKNMKLTQEQIDKAISGL